MENDKPGRLEEREERQSAEQQHGDSFVVDTNEPTDTSGIPTEEDEEAMTDETPGGSSSAWIHHSRYAAW
jgi:hypothetical protein